MTSSIRLCSRAWCNHPAIRDGRFCREHLNETLRETRPQSLREPAWRTWTREHAAAKDMTGAAA